jgi:hypothetical protein
MNGSFDWVPAEDLDAHARAALSPAAVVLDVGCGIRPQGLLVPEVLICIEPHEEYAEILATSLARTNTVIIAQEALAALRTLPSKCIDTTFLIDVIEHMPKEVGREVLEHCARVSRQQIVVFTPLGFMPQDAPAGELDGWNLHGETRQAHLSGWYPDDFPGWRIFASRNFHGHDSAGKPLPDPYGAFYAVLNCSPDADCFNTVRAGETLRRAMVATPAGAEMLGHYMAEAANQFALRGELGAAIAAARAGVVEFIDAGVGAEQTTILSRIARRRTEMAAVAAKDFEAKVLELRRVVEELVAVRGRLAAQTEIVARTEQLQDEEARLALAKSSFEVQRADMERAFESRELALAEASSRVEQARRENDAWSARLRMLEHSLGASRVELDRHQEYVEHDLQSRQRSLAEESAALDRETNDFRQATSAFYSSRIVKLWLALRNRELPAGK